MGGLADPFAQVLHGRRRDFDELARAGRTHAQFEQPVAELQLVRDGIAQEIAALHQHEHHAEDLTLRATQTVGDGPGRKRLLRLGEEFYDLEPLLECRGRIGEGAPVRACDGWRHDTLLSLH